MNLPRDFKDLFSKELQGSYLTEFILALKSLKPSGNRGNPEMRAIESNVYDFVIDKIQAIAAVECLTGEQLREVIGQYKPKKKFGLSSIEFEHAEVNAITGDMATAFAVMRVATLAGRAFWECLSLQDGWHKKLLSFYLRGGTFIDPNNMKQIFEDPADHVFEVNLEPYKIEFAKDGSIVTGQQNLQIYAYDYMSNLRDYTKQPGRSAEDVFCSHEIFNQPYDQKYEIGVSAIFKLGQAMCNHLKLTTACQNAHIDVGDFLAEMAVKYSLPAPPDARPSRLASMTFSSTPKFTPDKRRYH